MSRDTIGIIISAVMILGTIAAIVLAGDTSPPPQIGALPSEAVTRLGKGPLQGVVFSPSGDLMALFSEVGLYVHDADSWEEVWTNPTTEQVTAAAFSPDETVIAIGVEDGTALLLDAQTGEEIRSLPGPAEVTALTWADQLVIIGFNNGTWAAVDSGGSLEHAAEDTSGVTAAAISPDQRLLATGNRTGLVTLWDFQDASVVAVLQGHQENNAVLSITWAGAAIVSGGRDGQVIVWDADTFEVAHRLTGHDEAVLSTAVSNGVITSIDAAGTLITWGLADGARQTTRDDLPVLRAAATSPTGTSVLISQANSVSLVESEGALTPLTGYENAIPMRGPVAWAGETVAAASGETIVVWDVPTSVPVAYLADEGGTVTALAWSPDGSQLAAGDREGGVYIWRNPPGSRVRQMPSMHGDEVAALAWEPEGQRVASAGSLDGTVKIWDMLTGELLQTLEIGEGGVFSLAWSPDGSMLAAGTLQARTYLFDASGEVVEAEPYARIAGHMNWITSLAFSPDSRLIAIGSADTRITLWDVATFDQQQVLVGHASAVRDIAFSPNGRHLASASLDELIVIWHVCEGGCQDDISQAFAGHSDGVTSIGWGPEGDAVASGSSDGTVIIWEVDPTAAPDTNTQSRRR